MFTIDTAYICDLPIPRQEMGFPREGDRGNTVLLLAHEMRPAARAAYQQAGCIHEGACIGVCSEEVNALMEQMKLRWCPWPNRGFTLAILPHRQITVLADRLMVSRLLASEADQTLE